MDTNLIHVGIEDMKAASGNTILRTTLGSCIAICLYDPKNQRGGLAHIMLPSLEDTRNVKGSPTKYADSAIPLLLYEILNNGGDKNSIYAKIAGGAQMFALPGSTVMSAIGRNNTAKVKDVLREMNINIIAEDTGGNHSRTIYFYLETGDVTIKVSGQPDKTI
ncbi:MAG: chemotaxis protein CheD [Spirochaetia bacterium]|jgi:chemotaxis protein CheD|nr:chemotaxis protein CheD [Spirochaetia bacterium]